MEKPNEKKKSATKFHDLPRDMVQNILSTIKVKDAVNFLKALQSQKDASSDVDVKFLKATINDYFNWIEELLAVHIGNNKIYTTTIDGKKNYCIEVGDKFILLDEIVDGVSYIDKKDYEFVNVLEVSTPVSLDHISGFLVLVNKYIVFCKAEFDYYCTEDNEIEKNIWTQHLKKFNEIKTKIEQLEQEIKQKTYMERGGKPRRRSFESLTVPQLKEYAKRKQIRGYSKLNKAELIAALRKTRK